MPILSPNSFGTAFLSLFRRTTPPCSTPTSPPNTATPIAWASPNPNFLLSSNRASRTPSLTSPQRNRPRCSSRLPRLVFCYNSPMKAHVWVMPKRTVLDPQGQTIQHALSGLGYAAITDVRQGKFFLLNLDGWWRDEAQKQLEKISKDVLTNPVIEEYRFEIVD